MSNEAGSAAACEVCSASLIVVGLAVVWLGATASPAFALDLKTLPVVPVAALLIGSLIGAIAAFFIVRERNAVLVAFSA